MVKAMPSQALQSKHLASLKRNGRLEKSGGVSKEKSAAKSKALDPKIALASLTTVAPGWEVPDQVHVAALCVVVHVAVVHVAVAVHVVVADVDSLIVFAFQKKRESCTTTVPTANTEKKRQGSEVSRGKTT